MPPRPKRRKLDENLERSINDFKLITKAGRLTNSRTIVEESRGRNRDGSSVYALRRARGLAFKYMSEWASQGKIPPSALAYLRKNDPGFETCKRLNIYDLVQETEDLSTNLEATEREEDTDSENNSLILPNTALQSDGEDANMMHLADVDHAAEDEEEAPLEQRAEQFSEEMESDDDDEDNPNEDFIKYGTNLTFAEILQKWQAESGNTLASLTRLLKLLKKYAPVFDPSSLPKNAKHLMKV